MVDKKNVESYRPSNLDEALSLLNRYDCFIISGGTDVMVGKKGKKGSPLNIDEPVVFINHLSELKDVYIKDEAIHIGAACTYDELLNHPLIPTALKSAMTDIASPAIRNRGTIAGNICNASPAGDTLPLLYIYEAKLLIKNETAQRLVNISDFIAGPRRINLEKNEMVTEVILSNIDEIGTRYHFEKVGNRRADAIAKLSFAGAMTLKGDTISHIAFGFGAVGPTVVRRQELEQKIIGKKYPLNIEAIDEIIEDYSQVINPIDDQRSTADYRKKVSIKLLRHFLEAKN